MHVHRQGTATSEVFERNPRQETDACRQTKDHNQTCLKHRTIDRCWYTKQGITITRVWDRRKSASEQMGARFEQHNTTFHATRAFVRNLSAILILWELLCAGFRLSAGLHARVIPDGATCRPKELGDVRDVRSVLIVW